MSETIEENGKAVLPSDDYGDIEAAVMETARGRWFLAEHTRRNRSADTALVLEAISDLKGDMSAQAPPTADFDGMKGAIFEMAEEIAAAKREISAIGRETGDGAELAGATAELDAVVDATEGAASDILEAAEAVQELAWTLREEGVEDRYCDAFDARATEIYTACSFQDITGQRTKKVVRLLQRLDDRISTLAGVWGGTAANAKSEAETNPDAALLNGPARAGDGVSQEDVDLMLVDLDSFEFDTAAESARTAPAETDTAEPEPMADAPPTMDDEAGASGPAPEMPSAVQAERGDGEDATLREVAPGPVPATPQVPLDALSQSDKDALFA